MSNVASDFWPQDFGGSDVSPPIKILREQAALLYEKTKYTLRADVATHADNLGFQHSFNILVPALDYTYRLFRVAHSMDPYPVTVYPAEGASQEIGSEQEFRQWLKQTLGSESTKRILRNLLAQVES